MLGGSSTFATSSRNAIRDCCGGPNAARNLDVRKSATLGGHGRCVQRSCPDTVPNLRRCATLGRQKRDHQTCSSKCSESQCDVVKSGMQQAEKLMWRFDCDLQQVEPDVTHRSNETVETRTTSL